MSQERSLDRELNDLLDVLFDGTPTRADVERLHALFEIFPDARRRYVAQVFLHGALYWNQASRGTPISETQEAPVEAEPLSPIVPLGQSPAPLLRAPVQTTSSGYFSRSSLAWPLFFATLCIVSFLLTAVQLPAPKFFKTVATPTAGDQPSASAARPVVARLLREMNCVWGGEKPPRDLKTMTRLRLCSGVAEIAFTDGARVILEGPANFEVRSSQHAVLNAGRLTARLSDAATGFEVHTPTAVVVDLGTEFGADVDEAGATEVVVFNGLVEVREAPAGNSSGDGELLSASQAARVTRSESIQRLALSHLRRPKFVRAFSSTADKVSLLVEDFEGRERQYRPDDRPGVFDIKTKWGQTNLDFRGPTSVTFASPQGWSYFYGQCLDDRETCDTSNGAPDPPGHAITFGPVAVSDYEQLELRLLLAATSSPRGPFSATDFMVIETSHDGEPFQELARFTGPSEGQGTLRATVDGRQYELIHTFQPFAFPLSAKQSVEVRIRCQSADGSTTQEAYGIDYVQILGVSRTGAAESEQSFNDSTE